MDVGKGIAIAGIWIGTGMTAFGAGEAVIVVAMFAAAATFFVALFA